MKMNVQFDMSQTTELLMSQRIMMVIKGAVASLAVLWSGAEPAMKALLLLMLLDFASGLVAGFMTRTLSSDVSRKGLGKKVLILILLLGLAIAADLGVDAVGLEQGLDTKLVTWFASFYCAHETLSILENASRAGVPLPRQLVDAMVKSKKFLSSSSDNVSDSMKEVSNDNADAK